MTEIVPITPQDFDAICRFCLQHSVDLQPIFKVDEHHNGGSCGDDGGVGGDAVASADPSDLLATLVNDLTGLQTCREDGLPPQICNKCSTQLHMSHNFREQCILSVGILTRIQESAQPSSTSRIKKEMQPSQYNEIEPDYEDDDDHPAAEELFEDWHHDGDEYKPDDPQDTIIEPIPVSDDFAIDPSATKKRRKYNKTLKTECDASQDDDASATANPVDDYESPPPKKPRKPRTPKSTDGAPREKKPIKQEQCDICGAISRSLKTHMLTHSNEKKFECDFCGRKFSLRSSIKNHLFAHVNIRPYKCPHCTADYIDKAVFKRHLHSHSETYLYTCQYCARPFMRKYCLDKHIQTHLQIRRFPCDFCTHTFLTAEGLRNHVGVHTGQKPFKCGLCPMAFNFTASSSLHRRKHLVDGQFVCEKCAFAVKNFGRFKAHLAVCMPGRLCS